MTLPVTPSEFAQDSDYQHLLGHISTTYTTGQSRAVQVVNAHITETYWQIGHDIVEFEQGGKARATYGKALLASLSRDLTLRHGKGFTFVGRQYRITLNNTHYRVNLVFYHRILRCFVLIDLKINEVQHHDIGQMNLYLGYFAAEENTPEDNPPIGIILTRHKDELLVEYATYQMNSQLFVQKNPRFAVATPPHL